MLRPVNILSISFCFCLSKYEFYRAVKVRYSVSANKSEFALARFEIKEPTLENWLSQSRLEMIESYGFPLKSIANPVLLSYLRNISDEKITEYLGSDSDKSLATTYIEYLLAREQTRQRLKISINNQLRIFRKLIRFMTEYDFTAEGKPIIKEFLKEYNLQILAKSLKQYTAEEKPSIDDLVDTLSNHVFLDRKPNGLTGFVNDFIFGQLVGDNLLLGKYKEYYPNYYKIIPLEFSNKCIQVFKVHSQDKQDALWEIFNNEDFNYPSSFYFDLDINYKNIFSRQYKNLTISDKEFDSIDFSGEANFSDCTITNTTFQNCKFQLSIFKNCSFYNSSFYSCQVVLEDGKAFNDFALYACTSDNNFCKDIVDNLKENKSDQEGKPDGLGDKELLSYFFNIGGTKPKAKKLSSIKRSLDKYSNKEVSKVVSVLKHNGYLYFKDDVGFISKQGIQYYNQLNRI